MEDVTLGSVFGADVVLHGGNERENVVPFQRLDQEGVGAELIAFVDVLDIGETGEHHQKGSLRERVPLERSEDFDPAGGTHQKIEEENCWFCRLEGTSPFEIGDAFASCLQQVNWVQNFARLQNSLSEQAVCSEIIHNQDWCHAIIVQAGIQTFSSRLRNQEIPEGECPMGRAGEC